MENHQKFTFESPVSLSIGVLLFPHFQALDVFGPLDALNLLSESRPLTLALIAPTLEPQCTSSGTFTQQVLPTHTYTTCPPISVLIVPGGPGTRDVAAMVPAIAFVRSVYSQLEYLISVCTGAAIVAQTRLLDGRRGTTNKRAWGWVTGLRPQVEWVEKARWVVDGGWWSSSGVSAGMDVMFAWIKEVWGEDAARDVSVKMEYTRCSDAEDDPFAEVYGLGGGKGWLEGMEKTGIGM